MDNLRRFPAPWTMEERKDSFEVKDASGFSAASPIAKISIATATSTPTSFYHARKRGGLRRRSPGCPSC